MPMVKGYESSKNDLNKNVKIKEAHITESTSEKETGASTKKKKKTSYNWKQDKVGKKIK